jgi:hypothetical protein
MRLFTAVSLVAGALLLPACGGGSGDPTPVTVTLLSTEALNGAVSDKGTVTTQGTFGEQIVGDSYYSIGPVLTSWRMFVSFDLSSLPPGATVTSATLKLHQTNTANTPYATLGALLVDHVVYGAVLDAGSYDRSFPTGQGLGPLATDATVGTKSLDGSEVVQEDLASARGRSQFRIRFTVENDGNTTTDLANFRVYASSGLGNEPLLVVTYLP